MKNEEKFLILGKDQNKYNELNTLKEENIILKKEIDDFKKEIVALKSHIFLLEEKNKSLIQNNEIKNKDINNQENLISSLNSKINSMILQLKKSEEEKNLLINEIKIKENEIVNNIIYIFNFNSKN